MEIAEVVDQESLKAYINEFPLKDAITFAITMAFRMSARVAPTATSYFSVFERNEVKELSVVHVFLTMLATHVNSSADEYERIKFPTSFEDLVNQIAESAHDLGSAPAAISSEAIVKASKVNWVSEVLEAFDLSSAIAFASGKAEGLDDPDAATAYDDAFWGAVRRDLEIGPVGFSQRNVPLWSGLGPMRRFEVDWLETRDWLTDENCVANWSFWIAWYERLLSGADTRNDLLLAVLKGFEESDWVANPAQINPLFDDVLAIYAVESAQLAERIKLNDRKQYYAEPVTQLPEYLRDEAIARARDALSDFQELVKGQQSYLGAFAAITKQIRDWIDRYGDRPMRLYEKLADAQEFIDDIARDCGLSQEQAVLVLKRELERSRTDIRASDPVVEQRINARVRVRFDEMKADAQAAFLTVIEEGAAGAEVGLQSEMREDIPLIEGLDTPNDVRERALVREGERIIQINQLRPKEVEKPPKSNAAKVERAADVGNKIVTTGKNSWWVVELVSKFFL